MDTLSVRFLIEGEQTANDILAQLTAFIRGAEQRLDLALYDVRLTDALLAGLKAALDERASAGVQIRIVYDGDKPDEPALTRGMDPATPGTGGFVRALGHPWRRIGGFKLMHHKFIVRDAGTLHAAVWTGSTNMTTDAWQLQENNIVILESAEIADVYARDFEELWEDEDFEDSGDFATQPDTLTYRDQPAVVHAMFSPGRGDDIDELVAHTVRQARKRVRICSMLMNSSSLISALCDVLEDGRVLVSGVYDRTQQESVYDQWQALPQNQWKIPAIRNIVAQARLAGKNSLPYRPDTPHDFMHNKVIVVDNTVITGSYNFSRSAQKNAENILFIESALLAEDYSAYISSLEEKFR